MVLLALQWTLTIIDVMMHLHTYPTWLIIVCTFTGIFTFSITLFAEFNYVPIKFFFTHRFFCKFSFRENTLWSFTHNTLSFDPLRGDFDVAGVQFEWNDGIFSITLSNRRSDGYKTAFFHAMASTSEFAVSTQVLRNQSLATRSYHGDDFRVKYELNYKIV